MNKNIIIATIIIIGMFGILFFYFRDTQPGKQTKQQPQQTLPIGAKTDQPIIKSDTTENTEESTSVVNDFILQTPESNKYTLYKTTIVSNFALQEWGNGETGGQALLKKSQNGWVLLSSGGGAWNVDGLMKFGVPRGAAKRLVDESTQ